jgi:restriction system protein
MTWHSTRPASTRVSQLIDGANLLYLLAEHAGVEAKIVAPDGWRDPIPDIPEPVR